VENVYIILQFHSGNGVPKLSESPEFYMRYYKKPFGLFFGHSV